MDVLILLFIIIVFAIFSLIQKVQRSNLCKNLGEEISRADSLEGLVKTQQIHISELLHQLEKERNTPPKSIKYRSVVEVPQIASDEYREQILNKICKNLVQEIYDSKQIILEVQKSPKYTDSQPLYVISGEINLLIKD